MESRMFASEFGPDSAKRGPEIIRSGRGRSNLADFGPSKLGPSRDRLGLFGAMCDDFGQNLAWLAPNLTRIRPNSQRCGTMLAERGSRLSKMARVRSMWAQLS